MRLPAPFSRRDSDLPREVRSVVPGRPLAAAATGENGWLVGTRDALIVVGDGVARTVPWEEVQHADWNAEASVLEVTTTGGGEPPGASGRPASSAAYTLAEPGPLLALVRERVTASIVVQRRHPVAGKRGLTVVGRRAPSRAGPVTFSTRYDTGIDPEDPSVRAVAAAAMWDARESVGL